MNFIELTESDGAMFDWLFAVYEESFTYAERRDREEQRKILAHPAFHCLCMTDGDVKVGGLTYWQTDEFIYVEHLFCERHMRGKGYGSIALDYVKNLNKTVILEIEPPVTPLQFRRQAFYEKNGFVANDGIRHIQPKLHVGDGDLELLLMSYPDRVSRGLYENFAKFLKSEVQVKPLR